LFAPKLGDPAALVGDAGPFLVLASAFSWALGSLVVRYRRRGGSQLVPAAYQMVLGGLGLAGIGLALGQHAALTGERFTAGAVFAFFYLLTVGSLLGFVAYTWLLGHVSAALAGTYAYVNPLVALLIGWLLGGEELTGWLLGGVAVILAGVALVRSGGTKDGRRREAVPAADGRGGVARQAAGRAGQAAVTGGCQSP
ncbi:MAG TPA: EamA family transporter, partial [Gemmataceae bacterium]|nr:EamA family transporter [Gemmataceae bacterium]